MRRLAMLLWIGLLPALPAAAQEEEPPLPVGLQEPEPSAEPALPEGLDTATPEPALPEGLGGEETEPGPAASSPTSRPSLLDTLNLSGFWEIRGGVRTQRDPDQRDASLGETRLQLELEHTWRDRFTFKLTADLLYDQVRGRHRINLERGFGFLDLREASLAFSPLDFMDVKVGRQVLTWGTGDLLFLNDLFPKDWQSFFIGRDTEYLKAPSDALKLSLFSDLANWDIVFTPRFDPDRFITGERLSYYNPLLRDRAGRRTVQHVHLPDDWFHHSEWATRLSRNVGGWELAAYGYWGYWKSPSGMNLLRRAATFPRLSVYGASLRGPLAGGVANAEVAYYDSREDRDGDNPFVENGQWRFLVGYERQLPELATDLTLGAQYYLEWMTDYDAYRRTLWPITFARDEVRQVLTLRVTRLLLNQNLTLGLFAYYSPTDADAYLRPNVKYKLDDHWTVELGGNVFFGNDDHTFFAQFERNSNVYLALRYGF